MLNLCPASSPSSSATAVAGDAGDECVCEWDESRVSGMCKLARLTVRLTKDSDNGRDDGTECGTDGTEETHDEAADGVDDGCEARLNGWQVTEGISKGQRCRGISK